MKISIDTTSLLSALKRVAPVCNNAAFSVLSNCMLTADGDKLTISATDLATTIKTNVAANVSEEGNALIDCKQLISAVSTLKGDALLSTSGNKLKLECGRFKAAFNMLSDLTEYPRLDEYSNIGALMGSDVLKRSIDNTAFCVSKDDTRPDFTGTWISISDKLTMVSTDGHRLAKSEDNIESIDDKLDARLKEGIIVCQTGLNAISKAIKPCKVRVSYQKNRFVVVTEDGDVYASSLVNGQFPDFTKVFPASTTHNATIYRNELLTMVKASSGFSSKLCTIRFTLSKNKVEVSTYSDNREMTQSADCEYSESGVTIGLNWKFLLDALNVMSDNLIRICLEDEDCPIVIKALNDAKAEYIIMPMQLN